MTNGEPQPTPAELMRERRIQRNLKIVVGGLGALILLGLGSRHPTRYRSRDRIIRQCRRAKRENRHSFTGGHPGDGNPERRQGCIYLAIRQSAGRTP